MTPRTLLLSLLILLTGLVGACNGCSTTLEAPDDDPEARITALAQLVPEDADAALVVPEIRNMPDTMEYILSRHGHVDPGAQDLATRISRDLGVQITDMEMMELAGFHPDGSLMVSMVEGRPVLTADIADKNAFQRYVPGHVRREQGTETRIEDEEFGDREFRVSGDSTLDDTAWTFDGSAVVMVMPPYDFFSAHITNSADDVAAEIGEMSPEATLADSDAFAEFRTQVGDDSPVSLYLSWDQLLDSEDEAIDTMGLGFRADPQSVEIDAYATGTEADFVDAADIDWNRLMAHEFVQLLVSGLALDADQLASLGDIIAIETDDQALRLDFGRAHQEVTDIAELEDYISLVRALDDISISADVDEDLHFQITLEFTESLDAQ